MVYTDSWYFQQNSGVETFSLIFVILYMYLLFLMLKTSDNKSMYFVP